MKRYRILIWSMAILVWVFALVILIKALTDGSPQNPFSHYRIMIGVGFILLTGFLRSLYKATKG